jgi:hypothetical protein
MPAKRGLCATEKLPQGTCDAVELADLDEILQLSKVHVLIG